MNKLGFIGFGEAASNIALGISEKQPNIQFVAFDMIGVEATAKNLSLNVDVAKSSEELLSKAETIIIAIPGSLDLKMFKALRTEQLKSKLIVDICTAKPVDKLEISKIVDTAGGYYVDAAAMGSFPSLKHQVPLLISGSGAKKMLDCFDGLGMNMKEVGTKAGDAMVVKLCRSIYMKGLAALAIEMTEVSEAYGVKDWVWSSLAESMDNDKFMVYTPRLITGTIKNLKRRTSEVEECIDLITSAGKTGFMTEATLKLYKSLK